MDERKHTLRLVVTLLLLCGAGAWICGQLVERHADLWSNSRSGGGLFERVCRATESIGLDCSAAHESRWAQITLPLPLPSSDFSVRLHRVVIPLAFLGLAYFVFLGTWFLFVGRPHPSDAAWQRMPLIVGWLGAAVSVFYLAIMVVGVAPRCLWCGAAHAVNLLAVLAIRRLYRVAQASRPCFSPAESRRPKAAGPRTDLSGVAPAPSVRTVPASRLAVHAVAVALILIAGLWFYRRQQLAMGERLRTLAPYKQWITALRQDPEFLLREFHAQRPHRIPPRPDDAWQNDQPQLVVFTDYECSACYCSTVRLREQVLPAFDGRLTISVRHFPLCDRCNAATSGTIHPDACEAAWAAEAARLQGGEEAFRQMHRLLFENRRRLGAETYRELAVRIGLDGERLLHDLESEAVRRIVREDVALARELGVAAAPVMFLNGRRITAFARDNPVFWQAVAKDRSPAASELQVTKR